MCDSITTDQVITCHLEVTKKIIHITWWQILVENLKACTHIKFACGGIQIYIRHYQHWHICLHCACKSRLVTMVTHTSNAWCKAWRIRVESVRAYSSPKNEVPWKTGARMIVGLICIIFPLLMTPFIVSFVITNQVNEQIVNRMAHWDNNYYIPLRGCIKVAARGLKRTKVPCDYVMRTILSFDVWYRPSVQRSRTAGKKT